MNSMRLVRGLVAALLVLPVAALAKPAGRHHTPKAQSSRKPASTNQTAKPALKTETAPAKAGDEMLYDGEAAEAAGIKLSDWGGGSVADSTNLAFAKTNSIKITTIDPYQGAKITFGSPINLGDISDKTRYLAFTLRQTRSASPLPPVDYDPNGGEPGMPGPDMGAFPGQMPDGMPPQEQPRFDEDTTRRAAPTPLRQIHLVLTLADGTSADLMRPLPQSSDSQGNIDQWINFAVPLSALGLTESEATSPLQSITIAGNQFAVLYVGQIKISRDSTPITCFAGDEQSVAVDQPVTLSGNANGGLSTLHYAWDLQTKDQFVEQASGPSVTTSYPKAGDYNITLTVSDIDGIKKSATSTTVVHVK